MPFAWFVPFAADERWLVLGASSEPGEGGRATAAGTRTLVYATAMSQARTRVAKALAGVRPATSPQAAAPCGGDPASLLAELREVGAWLDERMRRHPDIQELYLGRKSGERRSYREVKQYRRSRRWYG